MKRIKVIPDNQACVDAIKSVLQAVNGRAHKFAITEAEAVFREAKILVLDLDPLPVKDRARAVSTFTPAGPWAAAYKWGVASTELTLEIGGDGKTVYLSDVKATSLYPKAPARRSISISADSHARYVAARAQDFSIVDPDPAYEKRRLDREARVEADRAVLAHI